MCDVFQTITNVILYCLPFKVCYCLGCPKLMVSELKSNCICHEYYKEPQWHHLTCCTWVYTGYVRKRNL